MQRVNKWAEVSKHHQSVKEFPGCWRETGDVSKGLPSKRDSSEILRRN